MDLSTVPWLCLTLSLILLQTRIEAGEINCTNFCSCGSPPLSFPPNGSCVPSDLIMEGNLLLQSCGHRAPTSHGGGILSRGAFTGDLVDPFRFLQHERGAFLAWDPSVGIFRAVIADLYPVGTLANYSVALGHNTQSSGEASFAVGDGNFAQGDGSVAMGFGNFAQGVIGFAAGAFNNARGDGSVSLGRFNSANGPESIAIGSGNTANVTGSFGAGSCNLLSHPGSGAIGVRLTSAGENGTIVGQCNNPNVTDLLFGVGNGDILISRKPGSICDECSSFSNALEVHRNGTVVIPEILQTGSLTLRGDLTQEAGSIAVLGQTLVLNDLSINGDLQVQGRCNCIDGQFKEYDHRIRALEVELKALRRLLTGPSTP